MKQNPAPVTHEKQPGFVGVQATMLETSLQYTTGGKCRVSRESSDTFIDLHCTEQDSEGSISAISGVC